MASFATEKNGYPLPPASVATQGVDSRAFAEQEPVLTISHKRGTTPYLGLPARLSQVWFNRWTVLLLLVLVRLLLLMDGLNDDLGDAKVKALSACTKVEDIGSSMASMPHYLSVGVNALTATGITKAVSGMVQVLELILDGVEALLLFVIRMMTDTYVCLIAAAVHGGLNVSAAVITKTTDGMNAAVSGIAGSLGTVASGATSAIDSAWKLIDVGTGLAGTKIPKPTFDISGDLNKLKNIKIDTSGFVSDLDAINKKLPTFDDVRNFTEQAVSLPFDLLKDQIKKAYGNWKFNETIFPVAQKKALSFCSDNSVIQDFFANLFALAAKARVAFIAVLVILAVLVCLPMAYWEIIRWRHQKSYQSLFEEHKYDGTDLFMMSSRPLTSKWGIKISNWFAKTERGRVLVRWAVAYGTSLPALFVLSLAIAGLFSCFCQFLILRAIQNQVPGLADQVGNFADEVVGTLEDVSDEWARSANGVVTSFNNDINQNVLGYVTNATSAVNNTINIFTDGLSKGLNLAFNGTILKDPISEVIRCLIGLKIESVQKGLTWVHDNARVDFPTFPNDTFSLGAQRSISGDSDLGTFLASPSSVTTDEVTGAVAHVVTRLQNSLTQEALISTGLLLVYVLIILIGVVRVLLAMAVPTASNRGDGAGAPATAQSAPNHPQFTSDVTRDLQTRRSERSQEDPFADPQGGFFEPVPLTGKGAGTASVYETHDVPAYTARTVMPSHVRKSSYGETIDSKR